MKTFVRHLHDNRGAKSRVRADVLMLIFNRAPVAEVSLEDLPCTQGGWWRASVRVGSRCGGGGGEGEGQDWVEVEGRVRVSVSVTPVASLRSVTGERRALTTNMCDPLSSSHRFTHVHTPPHHRWVGKCAAHWTMRG